MSRIGSGGRVGEPVAYHLIEGLPESAGFRDRQHEVDTMTLILIGGDHNQGRQLAQWLEAWGLRSAPLDPGDHPAAVPSAQACAVIYVCGPDEPSLPQASGLGAATAPLVLVGGVHGSSLDEQAWTLVTDPGPGGATLAAALRPCLEAATGPAADGAGFRDFLNHELRTPLTAAGTALQTLALQLERAGGQSLELVDIALRNIRRLEQTADWACDYLAVEPGTGADTDGDTTHLTDLLEDLDELDTSTPLSWATGAGDWDASVAVSRENWRRVLRQVVRALGYQAPGQSIHLELSTLDDDERDSGLLMVFHLPRLDPCEQVQRTGAEDEAEQLRRLLAFTVHPELARRLQLRFDVVSLSGHLRLRLMLPLDASDPVLQPA